MLVQEFENNDLVSCRLTAHTTVDSREEAAVLAVYACSILSKANIEQELPAISGGSWKFVK